MNDLSIWSKRWKTLEKSIEYVEANIQDSASRSSTIRYLLKNLHLFGRDHFNYFYNGFTTSAPNLATKVIHEEYEYDYPKEAVLRAILDQIAFDLEIINRALNQRKVKDSTPPQDEKSEYERKWHDTLKKADLLGQLALKPAIQAKLIDQEVTVLTYFQKATTVRVVPYAKVAIIGIPFTAIEIPRDLLAIPHEVAHYVFRHGYRQNENEHSVSYELKQKHKSRNLYLQNWLEEMFADIYGCLVAGPVIALDFQDLQLDDPLEEFFDAKKDNEDPVPIIRPDIYNKFLALRANKKEGIDEMIKDHWIRRRDAYMKRKPTKKIGADTNNTPSINSPRGLENAQANDFDFKTGNTRLKLDHVRGTGNALNPEKQLDDMLSSLKDTIFAELLELVNDNENDFFDWSGDLADITQENIEEIYSKFAQALKTEMDKDASKAVLAQLENAPENATLSQAHPKATNFSTLWINFVENWVRRNGFPEIKNVMDELLVTERNPRVESKEDWGWLDLAYADGWVTRGPEPNPPGDEVI